MAAESITKLKNTYRDQTIFVIASGPSLNWIDANFFANKVTVGLNEVHCKYKTTFLVRKEHNGAQRAIDTGIPLVLSKGHCGSDGNGIRARGTWYEFAHPRNQGSYGVDLSAIGSDDKLVVSWSTITTALHFAAYLGARDIIVCGHDCGKIDGKMNFDGYSAICSGFNPNFYEGWIKQIEKQTILVREKLTQVYSCHIYSLNPFLNLGAEGHLYER